MRIAAVLLAVVLACVASPARAGPEGEVAASANRALAALRSSFRSDDALHASAVRTLTSQLRRGLANEPEAFATHVSALTFLLEKLDRACDTAAAAFVSEASDFMFIAGDDVLPGAVPGDGGALDRFESSVRKELDRVRGRVDARLRNFEKAFVRAGGPNTTIRSTLAPWEFSLPATPSPTGVVPGAEEPPRLRAMCATRLSNGRVLVALAGTADPAYAGAFDVRLRGVSSFAIGPTLAEGGMPVSADGAWSVSLELGNPYSATVPLRGNRVVQFGVEPYDAGGIGGIRPGRVLHAATFGLP